MSPKRKVTPPKEDAPVKAKTPAPPKKVTTFELRLSVEEVVHLRDIMSVLLPPDGSTTLSQALAQAEERTMQEAKLWAKIIQLCTAAGVPVGNDAPDYAIGMAALPVLGVFPIQAVEEPEESPEE